MIDQDDIATRCATAAAAVAGHGDLDKGVGAVLGLPDTLPARGALAASLLEAMVRGNPMTDPRRLRAIDDLLPIAVGPQPPTARWTQTVSVARMLSIMRAIAEGERTDYDEMAAQLDALGTSDPGLEGMRVSAQLGLRFTRALKEGDPGVVAGMPAEVASFLERMPQHDPRTAALGRLMTAGAELMAANQSGGDVAAALARLAEANAALPAGDLQRIGAELTASATGLLGQQPGAGAPPLSADELDWLVTETGEPDLSDHDRLMRHTAVANAALRGGQETDLGRVELAVDHLRRALDVTATPAERVFPMTGLALGLRRRSELTNSTADLREARAVLESARTLAGGAAHPQWQLVNQMLSDVRQLLGGDAAFHRAAVEGLRSHVWRVLLQPDAQGVAAAVREAAADAVAVAQQCVAAEDPAAAIQALDAGRGLSLFAATEVRGLAQRLTDAGRDDLARRWADAAKTGDPAQLPTDLRRAVLTVLTAHGTGAELLDPPELPEIQRALARLDADALVYLVPGAGIVPGYLLAVPVTGWAALLPLNGLHVEGVPEVEAFARTLRRDVAGESSPSDGTPSGSGAEGTAVDAVCRWAWRAAIGKLVTIYLARRPEPRGRPRRVFLVAMGELAAIPWQAARSDDGRYAVHEVAISQTASARMLVRTADLPPVAPSPVGLLVGDPPPARPARPLKGARLEAFAIGRVLYPGARYVGRRPDGSISASGRGTLDEVRAWLRDTDAAAGTLLHLACHGLVDGTSPTPSAYLLLADGVLTAAELVTLMDAEPERRVGLVVLAACSSGVPFSGFDEAYSLATAFLAGGARTVLSSLWSVDDGATSALMFMFHRFLRDGRPAWAALREAQLWMLDGGRPVPDDMPGPLRTRIAQAELEAVDSWAAFVHGGQ